MQKANPICNPRSLFQTLWVGKICEIAHIVKSDAGAQIYRWFGCKTFRPLVDSAAKNVEFDISRLPSLMQWRNFMQVWSVE